MDNIGRMDEVYGTEHVVENLDDVVLTEPRTLHEDISEVSLGKLKNKKDMGQLLKTVSLFNM